MKTSTKKHGGHNAGKPSLQAQGRGPVFEIRQRLGLTQEQMAERIGCGRATIQRCEADGTLPRSRAVQSNLNALA